MDVGHQGPGKVIDRLRLAPGQEQETAKACALSESSYATSRIAERDLFGPTADLFREIDCAARSGARTATTRAEKRGTRHARGAGACYAPCMSTPVASLAALRGLALTIPIVLAAGCSGSSTASSTPARREAAAPAVTALRDGRFDESRRAAERTLAGDPRNSVAAAVRAISRYRDAMERLRRDAVAVGSGLDGPTPTLEDAALRAALVRAETALAEVDRDLAIAAADPAFELELCVACWREDWNGNGRMDEGDELLLQVELNADGSEIPEGDPRRERTFRLDNGDVTGRAP